MIFAIVSFCNIILKFCNDVLKQNLLYFMFFGRLFQIVCFGFFFVFVSHIRFTVIHTISVEQVFSLMVIVFSSNCSITLCC